VDPSDPNIIYAESQYGVLYRMDRTTGERRRIQPWQPQDGSAPAYRWNWSAPLLISPHDPTTLYFAANVVFRSRDRGDSWEVISPDLTRGISRDSLPLQGRVQPPDAIDLHMSTALYGNISTLALSPLRPGVVAAGTDDGLVQVTRDDGGSWHRTVSFPGVPEMMKVGMVAWSATAEGTLFAVFDGHKDNDFRPHVVRSDDFGESWRNVTGDLPAFGPTRSVAIHSRNGELVFVGTEFGVHFSLEGGNRWLPLRNNLPTVAVHDMEIHPRENDLVLGTHGRGFWVLDDLGLLEALTPEVVSGHSHLAQPRPATQIRDADRGRGSVGDTYWTARNPPRGAILGFWIGEAAAGKPVRVEILDETGGLIRELANGLAVRGAHRVIWDLRHTPPLGADGRPSKRGVGRFVLPGSYGVRLTVGDVVETRTLQVRMDPGVTLPMEDRVALEASLSLQADLVGAAAISGAVADTLLSHARTVLEALEGMDEAPSHLLERTRTLESRVRTLEMILEGPGEGGIAQQETTLPLSTLVNRLYRSTEGWTGSPTAHQDRLTTRAHGEMIRLLTDLRSLLENDLPALKNAIQEAGIPWPAGPIPDLPRSLVPPFGS
jgi:hypothetical protein